MGGLIKTLSVLALVTIILFSSVQVMAQTKSPMVASPTKGPGTTGIAGSNLTLEHSDRDIMTILTGKGDLGQGGSMMITSGLDRAMGRGIHTVFVPGDMAIRDMNLNQDQMAMLTGDMQAASDVMAGLITRDMVMPGGIARGKTLTMLDGRTMTTGSKDGTLTLDGARITRAIQATNGMIYVIDSMPRKTADIPALNR